MRREVSLEDISDGKLYTGTDMVKAGCHDCEGCWSCCKGMGNSLVLDPYDIDQMTRGLHTTFMELLNGKIQLNIVDGVILPNMNMNGENETCAFLDEKGRCSIHSFRPGLCRLFPLGRYYENHSFKYILQTGECRKENRTKVKIKKFLGIESLKEYETYINDWHYFLKDVERQSCKPEEMKALSMDILNTFFIRPYTPGHFFEEYKMRREKYHD